MFKKLFASGLVFFFSLGLFKYADAHVTTGSTAFGFIVTCASAYLNKPSEKKNTDDKSKSSWTWILWKSGCSSTCWTKRSYWKNRIRYSKRFDTCTSFGISNSIFSVWSFCSTGTRKKIELDIPKEVQVSNIQPVEGYKYSLDKDKKGNITKITWKAKDKGIGPNEFIEFPLLVESPKEEGTYSFKAVQTYGLL
jgi:hypothetical protein